MNNRKLVISLLLSLSTLTFVNSNPKQKHLWNLLIYIRAITRFIEIVL